MFDGSTFAKMKKLLSLVTTPLSSSVVQLLVASSGDSRKKFLGRPGGLGACSLRKIFTLETCLDQFEGIFKHKHITESMNQPT